MLLDCDLHDLGYSSAQFTWSNKREGECLTSECLDRCVGNSEWCHLFPRTVVCHDSIAYSDHLPLILTMNGEREMRKQRDPKPFRFESIWVKHDGSQKIIEESWNNRGAEIVENTLNCIRYCGEKLRQWNKSTFGHVQFKLKRAQFKLKVIQELDLSIQNREQLVKTRIKVQEWLKK